MNRSICRSRYFDNEDDAIMYIIEHALGADSKENAVTLDEIINMGIKRHCCWERPRDGKSGHPWSPRISVMMGIGTELQTKNRKQGHLFREKRTLNGKSIYYYWVDQYHDHRVGQTHKEKSWLMTLFERFKKHGTILEK